MGKYIAQSDLEDALSPQTVAEIFNDANTGEVSTSAMLAIIDRAEAEVDARLIGFYGYPIVAPIDRLLKHAALTFAMSFSFERHPEYVRAYGETQRSTGMYQRGEKLMGQVQAGIKTLPDQPSPTTAAANSGGIVYDSGPRFCIDSLDGTQNGNGF